MFRLQSRFLKFRPEDGLSVIAWGRLSVYSPRGDYQLILDTMEPAGLGGLMLAFEQLKTKLASEGLFAEGSKKPIPPLPRRVGIVTSRSGAAVLDMVRIIRRRLPATHVLLSPALVQGDRAPDEIVAALQRLCDAGDVDVIIVGRGGGSIEDLWAFNDERVVRAVASCPVPIVAAVGHETDFTLADFAADLRASTPSAAAELVVPDKRSLQEGLLHLTNRLRAFMHNFLDRRHAMVRELFSRVQNPRHHMQERRMRVDDLTLRLTRCVKRQIAGLRQDSASLAARLRPEHLRRALLIRQELAETLFTGLSRSLREVLKDRRHSVENLLSRLDALSPLAVLSRGYSLSIRLSTGAVLTDAGTVQQGEQVEVRLRHGELVCTVQETRVPEAATREGIDSSLRCNGNDQSQE